MTIEFTREEAEEILRQHVLAKLVKNPNTPVQTAIYCPDRSGTEIRFEAWTEEVAGE